MVLGEPDEHEQNYVGDECEEDNEDGEEQSTRLEGVEDEEGINSRV